MASSCFWHATVGLLICTEMVLSLQMMSPNQDVSAQNGSEAISLDCPYELDSGDEEGLVVKWFFNSKPTPIYQWIPGTPAQVLGDMKGRVDPLYEASDDQLTKHRALYIMYPTMELSGLYECYVSNFLTEESSSRTLTVYTAPEEVFLDYDTTGDSVWVFCEAEGLFPEPNLDLYKSADGNFDSMLLQEPLVSSDYSEENGTFSINLTQTFNHNMLAYSNKFMCSLTIPGTDLLLETDFTYEPDPTTTTSTTSTTTTTTTTTPPPYSVPIKSTRGASAGPIRVDSLLILWSLCIVFSSVLFAR